MCAHEWVDGEAAADDAAAADASAIKDSVGNVLNDGDSVSIVKSLKVKGSGAIKIGTKVSGIRIPRSMDTISKQKSLDLGRCASSPVW